MNSLSYDIGDYVAVDGVVCEVIALMSSCMEVKASNGDIIYVAYESLQND